MTKDNYHLLNEQAFSLMKDGVMIINTSRGELLDSAAAIEALKSGKIVHWGLTSMTTKKICFSKTNPMMSLLMMYSDAYRLATTCCLLGIKPSSLMKHWIISRIPH